MHLAHQNGVTVEAQVGHLPDGAGDCAAEATDATQARRFVEETCADALGIAVGNVHILTSGKAPINFETLEKVHEQVDIPLVLHGGTGIPLEMAQECIRMGVAKVNFGTGLKQAYLEAVRGKLKAYHVPMSPHPFLGMGGAEDILMAGADAVKREAKKLMMAYGSAGKAS